MAVVDHTDLERELQAVAGALVQEFAGAVPEADVLRLVAEARAAMGNPPVRQFVPILVARAVRTQLRLPQGG